MTTEPQPADLLAPLLALVAKWRDAAAVLSRTTDAIKNARAEAYQSCADQLQAAIESLAAHRGEVIGYVRRAPFYTRDAWQGCTKAEHDFINANGYWTNPKDGFNWPSITRPIYGDHPPQAQAGAGDAWIAVRDALPERPGWYVGCNYGAVEPLRFDGSNWHHTRVTRDLAMPSHWRPFDSITRPAALEASQ